MVPKTFSAILLAVIAKSIGGSANYKLLHSFLVVKKKGEPVGIRVTCPFFTVVRVIADYPRQFSHQGRNSHNTAFLQATITTLMDYISISSLSTTLV